MIVMPKYSGSMPAIVFAGTIAIGAAGAAKAADMPPLPSAPALEAPIPAPAPAQFSGWYLRGDVGYGINQISNYSSTAVATTSGAGVTYDSVDSRIIVDAGVGYQFNNWFRVDMTGEYRAPSRFQAFETYPGGNDTYSASIRTAVLLANGYVDLGNWYGFTPFVGAGVGAAFHDFAGLQDIGGGGAVGGYGTAPDNSTTKLAWAAMGGVAYTISPNWKLELSYRYLDMGNVASNGIICHCGGPASPEVLNFHMTSNDIRLGLRYVFADVPPIAPALPPVISRY